jgi:nucleoside-diphosphate-sugar epimerase
MDLTCEAGTMPPERVIQHGQRSGKFTAVQPDNDDLILVTGATGLVGSHFSEQAVAAAGRVRVLCRNPDAVRALLPESVQIQQGDLSDQDSLQAACEGATIVVHCAAKVGDWGPTEEYRRINVHGTESLLQAAFRGGNLKRWVQISSLGVYSGSDHYGTDETTPPNTQGIDGYTLTKVESEQLVQRYIADHQLPAVILRPGFIYGPRDRTVMPRLLERLQSGKFAYLGQPDKLMNNTSVVNLCHAIWRAIENDDAIGKVFNIRDPQAVTKKHFIETICTAADLPKPKKIVPLHVARFLSWHMEKLWKLLGKQSAPLVNSARIKFLGRNLDFCIDKATRELGYQPPATFDEAMPETVRWFRKSARASA